LADGDRLLKAIKVNYALLSWFLLQPDQFFYQKFLLNGLGLSKFSRSRTSQAIAQDHVLIKAGTKQNQVFVDKKRFSTC
jgi:hypothetical protein